MGSSVRNQPSLLQRSNVHTGHDNEKVKSNIDPPARYSSSPERANSFVKDKNQQLRDQVMLYANRLNSVADTEYINHHRHRLTPPHTLDLHHSQQPPFNQSSLDRQKSRPVHPYARALHWNNIEILSKALPIPLTNSPPRPATSSQNIKPLNSSFSRVTNPKFPKLRSSTSTPDLRYSVVLHWHDAVVTSGIQNANLILNQL